MLIDVWNAATFDEVLDKELRSYGDLIRAHSITQNAIFLSYDHGSTADPLIVRPHNPYAKDFLRAKENIGEIMMARTIRAWHYTRMTNEEVAAVLRDGIELSTPDFLRRRLALLTAGGLISGEFAERLIVSSPFQGDQREGRAGKFWFTSHPRAAKSSWASRLLRYWGGEVASFWTDDPVTLKSIEKIGSGRILEVAVPLAATKHTLNAADAVLATYARKLGCIESARAFDLFVVEALPESALVRVHSDGEELYSAIGDSYPAGYIDVERIYLEELTGQTD